MRSWPQRTLLTVEDNPAHRYALTRVLRKAGYHILEAASGKEMWEHLTRQPVDLVLLDINLPDSSGFDLCRRVKSNPDTSSIPVLHISASFVDVADRTHGLKHGADAYLTAPVEPEILLATVGSLLRSRRGEERQRVLAEMGLLALNCKDLDSFLTAALQMVSQTLAANGGVVYCKVEPLPETHATAAVAAEAAGGGARGLAVQEQAPPPVNLSPVQQYWTPGARPSQGVTASSSLPEPAGRLAVPEINSVSGLEDNWDAAYLPISASGEEFGTIGIYWRRERNETAIAWEAGEPEFLRAAASIIAATWFRLRAEEELQRLSRTLESKVEERTAALQASNDALQRSNRELESFAYLTSHDLKEPLRTIACFIDLISERYTERFDEEAREFMGFIQGGAARMSALLDDLLAYSRVSRQGQLISTFPVCEILDAVLLDLNSAIESRGARIQVDPLPEIRAIPTQIGQVFQNLIANAIKFCPAERVPQICISAQRVADAWQFSVQDNGVGFDPRYAELVFGVFKRLATREEFPGNGMGLAICRKVIERHGGKIWVETEIGQGARFLFTVPDTLALEKLL